MDKPVATNGAATAPTVAPVSHVDGPWRVETDHWNTGEPTNIGMAFNIYSDGGEWNVCEVWESQDDSNAVALANARLIAAAPDILAALKTLMDRGFTMATESIARKAIEKAEGR